MNFWIIHIVLIAVVSTGTYGAGSFLTHLHEQHPDAHFCDASSDAPHDGDSAPCSRADCDAHACCCTHNHHLVAFSAAVQGSTNLSSCEFHRPDVQTSLPHFSNEIFHPPVNG